MGSRPVPVGFPPTSQTPSDQGRTHIELRISPLIERNRRSSFQIGSMSNSRAAAARSRPFSENVALTNKKLSEAPIDLEALETEVESIGDDLQTLEERVDELDLLLLAPAH